MIELTQEEEEKVLGRRICPCSPSEVLKDTLESIGCSIEKFVTNSDITEEELLAISNGDIYITEDIANKLSKLFSDDDYVTDRSPWRVMQLKYDLWKDNYD